MSKKSKDKARRKKRRLMREQRAKNKLLVIQRRVTRVRRVDEEHDRMTGDITVRLDHGT